VVLFFRSISNHGIPWVFLKSRVAKRVRILDRCHGKGIAERREMLGKVLVDFA
jgi:hypothetical protein